MVKRMNREFPKAINNFPSTFNVLMAKQKLYSELLKLPNSALSDGDVDLMYTLSKDPEIQKILDRKI